MKSKKFLWFMLRLNLIVWLAAAATVVWLNSAEAANEKVVICHFGETKQVPSRAVESHIAHGDYLGVCVAPTPEPAPKPSPELPKIVIENMWLIEGWMWHGDVRDPDFGATYYTYCILISDTHPSWHQQKARCFPGRTWQPTNAPCAGPIYANDVWACDDELQERGWSRLSLIELCQRYPKWCDR